MERTEIIEALQLTRLPEMKAKIRSSSEASDALRTVGSWLLLLLLARQIVEWENRQWRVPPLPNSKEDRRLCEPN